MLKSLVEKFLSTASVDPPPAADNSSRGQPLNHTNLSNKDENTAMAISLKSLTDIDGFVGACLVDSDSGMVLGLEGGGGGLDLEVAAAGNTQVVSAKRKTMKALGLNDKIEDILISLNTQYHVIRPLDSNDAIFVYVALDRNKANLGMARMEIKSFEKTVKLAA